MITIPEPPEAPVALVPRSLPPPPDPVFDIAGVGAKSGLYEPPLPPPATPKPTGYA